MVQPAKEKISSAARADWRQEAAANVLTTPDMKIKPMNLQAQLASHWYDLASDIANVSGKEITYQTSVLKITLKL